MGERDGSTEIVIDGDFGESIEFSVLVPGTLSIESSVPYASIHDSGYGATTRVVLTFEDVMRLLDWLHDKGY